MEARSRSIAGSTSSPNSRSACRTRIPGQAGRFRPSQRRAAPALGKIGLTQCEPAGVAVAGFRQLAPIHHTGEESRIAVVDFAGQRILGGGVGEDLLAELAERP